MTIIAIGQILCIDGDRLGNLQKIEKAVEYAKIKKAEIIVFPESVIYGWVNPDAHFKATPIPGDDSDFLCKIAKKHSIFICIGLDENENNNLFDSAILIDDNGEILLKHQKINVLPGLMSPPYTKGNSINTIKTKFGNIGLLICADSFQTPILEQIGLKKPDLMLIPYGWAAPETKWPQHGKELEKVVKNVAITLKCTVIGANLVGTVTNGPWAGHIYGGQSVAVDYLGKSIALGKDREAEVLILVLAK